MADRDEYLRRTYGITLAEYDVMWKAQGGMCAICLRKMDVFNVDHDHVSGELRMLLCPHCNRYRVGRWREKDAQLMARVAEYLRFAAQNTCNLLGREVIVQKRRKKRPKTKGTK